jgi:GNAT superfamily N-acetyltransferase
VLALCRLTRTAVDERRVHSVMVRDYREAPLAAERPGVSPLFRERESQMIIREAHSTDALAIGRVQVDSWRTTYAGIVPADYLASLSYEQQGQFWERHISTLSSAAAMYVAEAAAEEVVGFAHSGPERSGNKIYTGELYAIYLLAAYQRQGLGRQLTRAVVNGLLQHGLPSMLVWVLAAILPAHFTKRWAGSKSLSSRLRLGRHGSQKSRMVGEIFVGLP